MSKTKGKSKPTRFFKVDRCPVTVDKDEDYMAITIYSHTGSATLSFWKDEKMLNASLGSLKTIKKDVTQLRDALNEVLEFLGEEK